MLHSWYIGHFDPAWVAMRRIDKIIVQRPLDITLVRSELERRADKVEDGVYSIGPDRFAIYDGSIRCLDFVRSSEAAKFMVEIAMMTGSQIIFPETGSAMNHAEFHEWFENWGAEKKRRLRAWERRSRMEST